MRRADVLGFVVAMAAALGSAAPAQAIIVKSPYIELPATNGYEASLNGAHEQAFIDIHQGAIGSSYAAPATVNPQAIDVEFGSFGGVHLTFAPEGEPTVRRIDDDGCKGTVTIRRGLWTGSVDFIPEGAFSAISATSLPGKFFTHRIRCKPPDPNEVDPDELDDGSNATSLDAYAGRRFGPAGASFNALRQDGRRRADFSASESKAVGDVLVSNYASVTGPRSAFRFDLEPKGARVTPPAPFTGSAVFKQPRRGEATWKGNLAVDFVSGRRALTGPNFGASLGRVALLVARPRDPARALMRDASR